MLRALDKLIASVLACMRWLALPITALLFLQWPLREIVKAYSRETNDLGQCLFALFVAASVIAASRAGAHLATDVLAQHYSAKARARLTAIGILAALMPWALFVLWSAAPMMRMSTRGLERFPDTGNQGYFIVKLALGLLVGLIVFQAILELWRGARRS